VNDNVDDLEEGPQQVNLAYLRVIPTKDGSPPIEGAEQILEDGTRVLRHDLPAGTLETVAPPDGGLGVFFNGQAILYVGVPMLLPESLQDADEDED
jgi:hypothetical protein